MRMRAYAKGDELLPGDEQEHLAVEVFRMLADPTRLVRFYDFDQINQAAPDQEREHSSRSSVTSTSGPV